MKSQKVYTKSLETRGEALTQKHTERRKRAGRPAPRSLSQDDHHKKSELAAATTVHAYDVKKPPVGVRFMRPVWKGSR